MFNETIEVDRLPINVKKGATYSILQSNPNYVTHGMFKYPCKFIPEIPRWGITKYSHGGLVFDPFSGSGTTVLEATVEGLDSIYTEIDDVAKLITRVKVTKFAKSELLLIDKYYNKIIQCLGTKKSVHSPCIDNIEHWFPKQAITDLCVMKDEIAKIRNKRIKEFFYVCFVSIIKKVSYADNTSPKPYVSKKVVKIPKSVLSEFSSIYKRYRLMEDEFTGMAITTGNCSEIYGDALAFECELPVDLVITSPPYINAFDYGRTMRLENLWLDYLTEKLLRDKKRKYVGTEKIDKFKELTNMDIFTSCKSLKSCYDKLQNIDLKRALVVKKFFEDMRTNMIRVYDVLRKDGTYVIVIGNSVIRGHNIESWKVLMEIGKSIGFKVDTYFSYVIKNPYIRIPRKGQGGLINKDYVVVFKKG